MKSFPNAFFSYYKLNLLLVLALGLFNVCFGQTPSGPLSYTGVSNLVIQNRVFTSGSGGACIVLNNCTNVTIRNCVFDSIPGFIGIQANNCTNVEVYRCTFYYFKSGVYSLNSKGINVHCNSFKNIVGPKPRGQIVQLNANSGSGNRINYNILDHTLGQGSPEDLINIYKYSGVATDPLQIIGNKLRGGGHSPSGGGIMVGDNDSKFVRVEDNILVNPGQYGVAAPSGESILFKNNTIFSKSMSFTNVGLYVGLASEIAAGYACNGPTITATGNRVNWRNRTGTPNNIYFCPCCPGIRSISNAINAPIDSTILPKVLTLDPVHCLSPLSTRDLELELTAEYGIKVLQWKLLMEEQVESFTVYQTDGQGNEIELGKARPIREGNMYQLSFSLPPNAEQYIFAKATIASGEEITSRSVFIPNPTSKPNCTVLDQKLSVGPLDESGSQLTIVDGQGQTKLQFENWDKPDFQWAIDAWQAGVYILHVSNEKEHFTCKFIR